ncbi:MAG: hypothetical protein K940chlam3_00379 [Chlamydiae bacterium]|nr:hypothetical protein [Chlamydiota bacterium]
MDPVSSYHELCKKPHSRFDLTNFHCVSSLVEKIITTESETHEVVKQICDLVEKSNLAFHAKQLESRSSIVEIYWNEVDWKKLPYDKSLRKTCDVVFLVNQHPIPAHSSRLIDRYPYFQALLISPFKENPLEAPIEIEEVADQTFLNFIWYVYKDKLPSHIKELETLQVYADMIGDETLAGKCRNLFAKVIEALKEEFEEIQKESELNTWLRVHDLGTEDIAKFYILTLKKTKQKQSSIPEDIKISSISESCFSIDWSFSLSDEELVLHDSFNTIKESRKFKKFGCDWTILIGGNRSGYGCYYGCYLKLHSRPSKALSLKSTWTVGLGRAKYTKTTSCVHKKPGDWGINLGVGKVPKLKSLICDGKLHINLKCERVEK